MSLTSQIKYNVTLTPPQIERVNAQVVEKKNRVAACSYAGIRPGRLAGILTGSSLKNDERDMLMKFCDVVEGINKALSEAETPNP